ncbi:hypothetical protein DCAR_0414475 [Daucus carota subsp. sativus]|uniref:Ubiquitin-like protease family profile domain-containing protein n=1 Tax=Daucus carota subsp. sativus TaxID=79200 RepID=A0AAF0WSX0_DAUCS|nr:PREDICTED: uncharacterized protein LOC108192476 [Daucus carota subsp. sativus]WOG95172.1 hypothetical protein DCAR_0414475 [Daucus carota subsp. sativus]
MSEQTSKIIEERDAFWAKEMEKLKAALCGKDIRLDGSPLINSQQGSCSKGGSAALRKDLDLNEGPRKKLKLTGDCVDEVEEEDHAVGNTTQLGEEMVKENNQEVEKSVTVVDEQLEVRGLKNDSERKLAVGSPTNFVAYGIVDTISDVLHGKPLEKENARVSITRVIQGAAKIPFPIGDEIMTVEQACGTFIAWPRDLILEEDSGALVNPNVKVNTKNAGKKSKKLNKPDAMVEMAADSPPILKRLLDWGKDALDDDRTISFPLCEKAFGSNKKKVLYLTDVQALCCGGEISGSIICMCIHVLENYLEKDKMTDMVTFVDPGIIGAIGCGSVAERARSLSARFKNAKKGQYFLLPYHHVNHWALTVVNPEAQTVCHMDPLKRRIASEEWIELVDNGIKLYKESVRKILKKKIVWENMAGVPVQTGTKDCGLFVMRYMKEICEDKDLNFASKWLRRKNLAYSVSDINEIKVEWANFFMKHHAR